MLQLTFKQTNSELLVRAAASVLFATLARRGAKLVSISDLAERPQYGFTAKAASEPVGPKFVRITDLQDGRIDWETVPFCECTEPEKYLLRDDDLLFARTGATTGKTHLVRKPEHAVFASYLIRLRPKASVFPGYLHAFFQSDLYWTQICGEKEGSAQPNVNGEKLAALQIPYVDSELQQAIADFVYCVRRRQDREKVGLPELPPPLAEQRRVVARIEELAAQIHEARILRHQAAEEAELLRARIAANVFDAVEGERKALGEVAMKKTGTAYRAADFVESGGVPVVRLKEIETKKPTIFLRNQEDYSNVWLEQNDIILAKTSFSTGAMCQWPGPPAVLNQNAVMLRAHEGIDQRYLFEWLGQQVSRYLANHLADPKFYPYIRESELIRWQVPVPPLSEQCRIVAELDALQAEVDALKRLQAESAAELDALLPAILDRAFKGEL